MTFWIDMIGWAASAAVLATFCMNTMMPLRVLAIISNVLFCAFGALAHIFPVLILHAILLPVNVVRLVQIRRVVHGIQAAENSELSSTRRSRISHAAMLPVQSQSDRLIATRL